MRSFALRCVMQPVRCIRWNWKEVTALAFTRPCLMACASAITTVRSVSSITAPRPPRRLYLKDDDYRLSFLYGSYLTLTNLSEGDWQRIEEQRLSPVCLVHATGPTCAPVCW